MTSTTKLKMGDDYAWVSCDGKPLPVYGVETNGNKTTAWIASDVGKAFIVTVQSFDRKNDISARFVVDGAEIDGLLIRKCELNERVFDGPAVSATAVRPMHFAVIKTSDDESHCMAAATVAKLGTISVEFSRVRTTNTWSSSAGDFAEQLQESVAIHEKQKKLGGHHTTLGAQKQLAKAIQFVSTVNIDSGPRTILEFKYRPKDILQAQDIIPVVRAPLPAVPSGSQPSSSNKRPLADSSNTNGSQGSKSSAKRVKHEDSEHTQRLEEYIRQLQSQLPADHPLLDDAPIVKAEPTEINAHKFFKKGEIIDLTDD